ncbi:E3 ubiquitin-protein ligase RNF170-like isoform X2 [Telopea speciosissima]|uniref:E3 ubiquitin-protein ligase RNF170-like isoform X2 n=1 Tax=Telopea speciosissima TaxID=54955 RepID=UPI001CC81D22|nr:E3 ubiquitin-protein ligase RNF170-like isoform X2 [Telopea speciosissima]
MDGPPDNDCCSICHDNFTLPCQANCSHWFCGNCILRVWHHGSALSPCKCPICRRTITLLIPSEASSQHRHEPEVSQVLQNIQRYNRSFGGGTNGLIQMLGSAIYILSPIDIIPEGVVGLIGILDDLVIALIFFLHIAAMYRTALLSRHGGS